MSYSSTLTKITEQVFTAKTLKEGKTIVEDFLKTSKIEEVDKKTMLNNINTIKSLTKLQSYMCNSLLKFEGLGTN